MLFEMAAWQGGNLAAFSLGWRGAFLLFSFASLARNSDLRVFLKRGPPAKKTQHKAK